MIIFSKSKQEVELVWQAVTVTNPRVKESVRIAELVPSGDE